MTDRTRVGTRSRAAFFDVDETLISVKSMFRFLAHHFAAIGRPPSAYDELIAELRALAAEGAGRAEVMRAYYRVYAGQRAADLSAQGRAWFRREQSAGELFLPACVEAFQEHLRRGDLTVLVSGSFAPCLDPLADFLGAAQVVGARLETVEGVHTGRLVTPMLGEDKAAAAQAVMDAHGMDPAECAAYGDHSSDLPMLLTVGHPVVVGDDPVLVRYATARGWRRLPGRTGCLDATTAPEDGAGFSPARPPPGWHR
ncbi:HAD family hydrolase [Streptomyces sp. RK9]|uniref:HAD family hydrolase n=1 Tax=Streptomyces sp. RK9 TaxID=3239284 RepID=UPI003862D50F